MPNAPARPSSPHVERLRGVVASRVEQTSLRAVAQSVGMSPAGLDRFLGGSVARLRSQSTLGAWEQAEQEELRSDEFRGEEVFIGALVRDLAPALRAAGTARLVRSLLESYRSRDAAVPTWLGDLAEWWLED
jgi:hypothetical protein